MNRLAPPPRQMTRTVVTLALALLVYAAPALAQPVVHPEDLAGWSIVPSVQTIGVYEDNVLFTAGPTTDGTFLRVTPSLETRYRGPLGFFNLGYSFDREVHDEHLAALNGLLGRQYAALNFASKPTDRTSLSGRAHYLSTQRPEEVLDPTGLVASARRTIGFLGGLDVDHKLSERSRAAVAYTLAVDDFGQATEALPGARTILHSATTSIGVQKSPRTAIGVEHVGKLLIGEERTFSAVTRGIFWANSVRVRWTQALTPHLSAVLAAGPRLSQTVPSVIDPLQPTATNWEPRPEVVGSLSYQRNQKSLAVVYERTQMLGYGASGFIDTESVDTKAAWLVARRLGLAGRSSVYRNSLAGLSANSYRLDSTANYFVSSWMTLDAIFSYKHQDRALALADFAVTSVAKSRTRMRIAFGATIRRPIRIE